MGKTVSALLVMVLTLFAADSCGKYDVPAGSAGGDSAGNNQPGPACQLGEMQMNPVAYRAPEVYNYVITVEIEDENCGRLSFTDTMAIDRVGAYGNNKYMVFDDGPSGIVQHASPYQTGGVIEKSKPHNIHIEATVIVTAEMLKAGAAWLTCRIERNKLLVTGLGQTGLARVALTTTGIHTVVCRTLT